MSKAFTKENDHDDDVPQLPCRIRRADRGGRRRPIYDAPQCPEQAGRGRRARGDGHCDGRAGPDHVRPRRRSGLRRKPSSPRSSHDRIRAVDQRTPACVRPPHAADNHHLRGDPRARLSRPCRQHLYLAAPLVVRHRRSARPVGLQSIQRRRRGGPVRLPDPRLHPRHGTGQPEKRAVLQPEHSVRRPPRADRQSPGDHRTVPASIREH